MKGKSTVPKKVISTSFNYIFWGLLFVFIDLRINQVDIFLPDFIGYLIIYSALRSISPLHIRFKKAGTYSIISMLFSLLDCVGVTQTSSQSESFYISIDPLYPLFMIGLVFHILMIWEICTGIYELALRKKDSSLAQSAINRRNIYVFIETISQVAGFVLLVIPPLFCMTLAILVPLSLIMMIMIMGLTLRAGRFFSK